MKDDTQQGFLTVEIMIAFSIFVLFSISTFTLLFSTQRLKEWSLSELNRIGDAIAYVRDFNFKDPPQLYGNDTTLFYEDPFTFASSSYRAAWGRSTCSPRISFDEDTVQYISSGVELGSGNMSTDIEVRNGIIYLTTDSSTLSPPDLFIIDSRTREFPTIISSIHTGPGLSSLEVIGPYIFAANRSTVSQLQVIDIKERLSPIHIASLRVPLPTASTTAPFARSIFYANDFIYLGTEKWAGPELFVINVEDPKNPFVVGSFETSTLINDIYVRENLAYLATADSLQMRVLDVSDPAHPYLLDSFSPSGWQTQEGKTLDYFEERISFGRTVGGFNVSSNHEAFIFSSSTPLSRDISGGVYGMLSRPPFVFILSQGTSNQFQVWNDTLSTKLFQMDVGDGLVKMACDYKTLFFATGDSKGFSVLELYE